MTDEPFDELDRALARGLSSLAPEVDAADETLTALRPRFRRARTRRQVMNAGVAVVALAVVGSLAVLAAPGEHRSHVQVTAPPSSDANRSTTSSPTSRSTTTTVHRPQGQVPPATSPTTLSSGNPGTGSNPTRPSGPPASFPGASPTTVSATTPGGDGGSGPGNGHGGRGPTTTTTVPAGPEVVTYGSPGGSVTVRVAHGTLELLSDPAAGGYHAAVHDQQPDDIDVRFDQDGGHGEWRIRVQIDHDGHLTHEISSS